MRRAIISDIHGNWEALTAVLADIESQNVSQIYCLGDIIGYGPNPRECLDRALKFDQVVLGNHDLAALFDPEGFSSAAEQAIFWTRRQLESSPEENEQTTRRRLDFLCELPRTLREPPYLFVHGSARSPTTEYVFPEDIYNTRKLEKIFSMVEKYCFQGHTHVPGVFTEDYRFLRPDDFGGRYRLTAQKSMVNVGSVGQPRDGDSRSCYVILEEDLVEFHRVEYPFQETAKKIYEIPDLNDFLGDRLSEGR